MVSRNIKRMLKTVFSLFFNKSGTRRNLTMTIHSELSVIMVTTWNTRCGVFAYSEFLMAELKKKAKVYVVNVPENHVISPYFLVLGYKAGKYPGIVHVQFASGMFDDLKLGRSKRLSSFTGLLLFLGLGISRCLLVTTFHEVSKRLYSGARAGKLYSKFFNKLISLSSDLIIVHNSESKELLTRLHGFDATKIKILPMGTPENPIFLDKATCKKKLGLFGKKVIMIPGFVSKQKGQDLVVKVLPQLDKDVHLLIAGGIRFREDEVYYNELKKLAQKLGCDDRITFNDYFPISSTILNATDIAILPYNRVTESMALRLLVAYKVPTITSDLSVFREIQREYNCIELFEINNSNDLLVKTKSLLSDPKKRLVLVKNCQKMWAATKWSSIAEKHKEAYMEVLAAHPDSLYSTENQRERLTWLKRNLSGYALEIGCATGFVADFIGVNIGLDLNIYRLKLAKRRYREKDFVASDALHLPFKEKAFNSVLIPEVLEHLPLPLAREVISEAKRVGDKILITLPNAGKPNYDKSLVETSEHLWFPTEEIVLMLVVQGKIEYTSEKDFILVQAT